MSENYTTKMCCHYLFNKNKNKNKEKKEKEVEEEKENDNYAEKGKDK